MASTTKALGIVTTNKTGLTSLMVLEEVSVEVDGGLHQTTGEDGEVITTDDEYYGEVTTLSAKGTQKTGYSRPSRGDALTVDGITYTIRRIKEVESKDEKPKFELTAIKDG